MESEPNNFLNWVEIKNFKSIKDLRLDCKRVNVFIGKPNVGKSNILEGLGLLGGSTDDDKYLNGTIRYDEIRDLFLDNNTEKELSIASSQFSAKINLREAIDIGEQFDFTAGNGDKFQFTWGNGLSFRRRFMLDDKGKVKIASAGSFTSNEERDSFTTFRTSPIKKYDFQQLSTFKNTFSQYLLPPYGINLYAVINRNPNLWQEFAKLFEDQNLEFILSDRDQSFVLQKKMGPRVKQYSFLSIADTFRRFMFYITAIESNKNSVIIFEEPEVHSFPPYTQDVAYRMIYSETNQFFVSTHSPYLLHTLVENLKDDQINVFVAYYENYETKVKALTPEELSFVQEYSTDVFFNLDRFIPNAQSADIA